MKATNDTERINFIEAGRYTVKYAPDTQYWYIWLSPTVEVNDLTWRKAVDRAMKIQGEK